MEDRNICFVCGSQAVKQVLDNPAKYFCSCPVCGRYEYIYRFSELSKFNLNHLGAYFVYNGFPDKNGEYRYFTTMSKEQCDNYSLKFKQGDTSNGHPVHLSNENVENWYPKTFSEKIDMILLYLYSRTDYMGEVVTLEKEEMFSCLFVDRYDDKNIKRSEDEMKKQAYYILKYLSDIKYVSSPDSWTGDKPITLEPEGYARVDTLQKNAENSKLVLVAMKFGDDTIQLREAIRKGITDAGYVPTLIDEVEHNNFITPELLKYIKDSKFVVVDLSHQNNGAYFEEGYAMGLGKPVIQLCKKDVRLHFDIAQKNTIIWEVEEEIAERLKNRIIATIS